MVVQNAVCSVREWSLAQVKLLPTSSSQSPLMQEVSLPPGTSLGNSEAAWSSSSLMAGLGWQFSMVSTTGMARSSTMVSSVTSPLLAEALALREALRAAQSSYLTKVWMRYESLELVRAVNSKSYPMELFGVLMDVEFL